MTENHEKMDPTDISVDEFFRKMHDELAFLELKEDISDPLGLPENTPLPIRLRDFTRGGLEKFSESIPAQAIVNGALWTIAIDPNFIHVDSYRDLVERALKEPESYAMSLAKKHFDRAHQLSVQLDEKNDPDKEKKLEEEFRATLISLRAAYILNKEDPAIASLYAQQLWDLGPKSGLFFMEIEKILDEVLDKDENNLLSNALLGDMHAEIGQFIKATSYYQKALENPEDSAVAEDIRRRLRSISQDTAIEEAIYYINRANYEKAYYYLQEAKRIAAEEDKEERYDIDYYYGLIDQNTGDFKSAAENFSRAIEKGGSFPDLYNGLVYALYADGQTDLAIKAAGQGLKIFEDDLRLLFNRALIYAGRGDRKAAMEDIDKILEFDNISDELFNETMKLREEISSPL